MKVSEMFPKKYASGADLNGKDVTLIIRKIQLEKMHVAPNTPEETKPVIYFEKAQKGIILTAPLARQIETILHIEEMDDWPGHKITLFPVPMQVAGKPQIAVRAKAPTNGTTPPPESLQDDEEG